MASGFGRGFSRIAAARQRLLDVRASRIEQLLRFRSYVRGALADFIATLDPITGARLVEIGSDGSKTNGDLALTIAFFEGSKLRFAVDRQGRYSCAATPPDLLEGIGRILEIRVRGDAARAEFDYEPVGEPGVRRSADLDELLARLVDRAATAAEAEADDVPERRIAFAAQIAEAARARGSLGFSIG